MMAMAESELIAHGERLRQARMDRVNQGVRKRPSLSIRA